MKFLLHTYDDGDEPGVNPGIDRVTNILKDKFGNDYRKKLDEYLERQRAKSPRGSQSESVEAESMRDCVQENSKEQNSVETGEKSDSICEPPCVLETTKTIEKSEENLDLEVKKLDATVGEKLKKLSLSDVKPLFEMVRKKYINANNRRFI